MGNQEMRTLIFGAKGQLGRDLVVCFGEQGEVRGVDLPELNITRSSEAENACDAFQPDVIVNAAAYTDVEAAESDAAGAYEVNEGGARVVAKAAAQRNIPVVYYSTDFVFNGRQDEPYVPEDAMDPLNVYGASKAAGEIATRKAQPDSFIIRTAWLYGPGGDNFVEKILRAAETRPELRVIEDEIGSPTHARSLAEATRALVDTGEFGTYHCVNEGLCSRYEFACAIVRLAGLDTIVKPCSKSEYPMKAKRPTFSGLSNAKLAATAGFHMPAWETDLAEYMKRR
jgi:dTDP-4-dehydrorhamnose reductase